MPHDELCPCFSHPDWLPETNCRCDLIAAVGERIAQDIETWAHDPEEAAQIARNGGRDA